MGFDSSPSHATHDKNNKNKLFTNLLYASATVGDLKYTPWLTTASSVPVLPPDGGWGWVVLVSAFILNCVVDGICFSFGVFYVELLNAFRESSAKTTLIVTLPSAVLLLSGPFVALLTRAFGCRAVTVVGSLISAAAIFSGSFATSINMLILTHGFIAGLGFGMMVLPSLVAVSFYFEKWRALATTIALSGSAIGQFAFGPFARLLINTYGWEGANVLLAGIILNGCVFGLLFRPLRSTAAKPRDNILLKSHGYSCEDASSDDSSLWNVPRSHIMRKLVVEKRLQRARSTGSLDGMIITRGNRLVRPSDLPEVCPAVSSSMQYDVSCVVFLDQRNEHISNDLNNAARVCDTIERISGADDAYHERTINVSEDLRQSSGASSIWKLQPFAGDGLKQYDSQDSNDSRLSYIGEYSVTNAEDQTSNTSERLAPINNNTVCAAGSHVYKDYQCADSKNLRTFCELVVSDSSNPTKPFVLSMQSPDSEALQSKCLLGASEKKRDFVLVTVVRAVMNMFGLSLFKSAVFALLCIGSFVPFIGYFVPYMFLVPYSMEEEGIPRNGPGYLVSVLGVSNFVGRLLAGLVANQSWSDPVSLYSAALIIGGLLVCVLPLLHAFELLCIYAAVTGVCNAAFVTLKSIVIVELLGLEQLTSAFGLLSLLQGVALLLGSQFAGLVFDVTDSFSTSFIIAGSMIALGGAIYLPIRRVACWEKRRFYAGLKGESFEKL